ncbi:hypothetical protein ACWEQL_31055 [Kitasatospora sp. NPDC004240]
MAVIAVVGGPGAPGATTAALALLLAWPLQPGRRIMLVECDPDGGAVLAGALEGRVEAVYGLRNLAVADRRGLLGETLWEQLIDLSPDGNAERLLLPGLTDPTQAPGLAYTWEPLVEVLHGLEPQGYDVILDLGRSGATGSSAVLARRADVVAATVRTTLRGLSSARPRLTALTEDLAAAGTGPDALGLLLVAEGPYSGAEVSREFALPVLGTLPYATRTARVLSDGGDITDRRFIRSELMRTARSAADEAQSLVRRRRQRLAPAAIPADHRLPAGDARPAVGQPYPGPQQQYGQQQSGPQQGGQPYGGGGAQWNGQPYGGQPVNGHQYAGGPSAPQPVPPQPVPPQPVIVTGPVAPLAGLAPQPAAPAPFPAHAQGDHVQPGYVQPGYVQPGPVQPGYVQPGYVQPGPVRPYGTGGPDDRTPPQDQTQPQPQGQDRRPGHAAHGEVLRAR